MKELCVALFSMALLPVCIASKETGFLFRFRCEGLCIVDICASVRNARNVFVLFGFVVHVVYGFVNNRTEW